MKTPRRLLLCLLCLPALVRAIPVDSHISAATVYADRAIVTRSAEVNLALGQNVLVFPGLPAGLIEESLQFSGHGTATATILDVNAETTYVDSAPNARVKDLEDQIKDLIKQNGALGDRVGVLNEERDFVKNMLRSATAPEPVRSGTNSTRAEGGSFPQTLDDWQKLYVYSDDTLGKIAAEVRSLDDQRSELAGKKAALELQLNELRGGRSKAIKNVTVRIDATKGGLLEVSLKYAVPGATWAPSYDARVHAAERTVELAYYGLVRNATGEDWSDVALTLSTARPSLGGDAPELQPWVVDVISPSDEKTVLSPFSVQDTLAGTRVRTDLRDAASPASGATRQFLSKSESQDKGTFEIAAAVEANATSATFKIPVTVSVSANNSLQKVPIAAATLAAVFQYEATPKLLDAAFLSAEASNSTEYPFLSGAMNTYLDETFVAASHLKTVMPGEKFSLHLGADEAISVKRKLVNRFAENTGLTNNGRRVTYEYLLTITNNKKTPEEVTFKEPLPVSRQEKIVVKLLTPNEDDLGTKDSPKEVSKEEDGRLVWHLSLKPAEKREIPLKFSVSYPGDLNISGLE